MLRDANPGITVETVETITDWDDAWDTFKEAVGKGWEGLMAKSRKAPYLQGKRSHDLLKIKRFSTVDGWVSGFVESSKGKSLEDFIGGFKISSYVDGEEREIAAYI